MSAEDAGALAQRAAQWLLQRKDILGLPDLAITTQELFLERAAAGPAMSLEEKLLIVDVTSQILRELYAHLPFKAVFKSANPNVNPLEGLAAIREQAGSLSDFDFHTCMQIALAGARDIHTGYTAPSPYRGAVAFLPFEIGFYEQPANNLHFIVKRTMATEDDGGWGHRAFRTGAEIVIWDEMTPMEACLNASALQPGANRNANLARGVSRLTIRAVGSHNVSSEGGVPPFQPRNSVRIRYIAPGEKKKREIVFPWHVATGFGWQGFSSAAFSQSQTSSCIQRWRSFSYKQPEKLETPAEHDFYETQFPTDPPGPNRPSPALLSYDQQPEYSFGYIRIRNFAGDSPSLLEDSKVEEFRQTLARFDRECRGGLIVDIRGNPGGQIRLAERILQMLSPRQIAPLRFHFPRTAMVEHILDRLRSTGDSAAEFSAWVESLPGDDEHGSSPLTPGRHITPLEAANDTGQIYQGPVVLLIDAITYSAADMFAAGFLDHEIGDIIGVDSCTGGGGANAWSYEDIGRNIPETANIKLPQLPGDCELHVAVRRCTRNDAGQTAIEAIGVTPTQLFSRTRRDLLEDNPDLFAYAVYHLASAPLHRIDISKVDRQGRNVEITLAATGIRYVVLRANSEIIARKQVPDRALDTIRAELAEDEPDHIRIEGYWDSTEFELGLPPLAAPRVVLNNAEEERRFSSKSLSFERRRSARAGRR